MENIAKPRALNLGFGWDRRGKPAVIMTVSPGFTITGQGEGPEKPGVALTPPMAREYAYALLLMAEEVSNGSVVIPPMGADSLQGPPQ